jgi:hypothetical protein
MAIKRGCKYIERKHAYYKEERTEALIPLGRLAWKYTLITLYIYINIS